MSFSLPFLTQATTKQKRERREICGTCPLLIPKIRVCSALKGGCGCFVVLKTALAGETCPLGKW